MFLLILVYLYNVEAKRGKEFFLAILDNEYSNIKKAPVKELK